MDFQEGSKLLLARLTEKILADQKALCMGCMKTVPVEDVAALGLYLPKDPGITGKHRLIAYPVCIPCAARTHDDLAQTVEGNIIREGIMIDPRSFGMPGDT